MKKIALVIVCLDKLVSSDSLKGGGSHVLQNILYNWIDNEDVCLDIYCTESSIISYPGINKIVKIPYCQLGNIEKFVEELKKHQETEKYDNILFGDFISPYGSVMLQSHSYLHRYNLYGGVLTKVFKKLKNQKLLAQSILFTQENGVYIAMSETIKRDYSENFDIPKEKIHVIYPGVSVPDCGLTQNNNETVTFGIVGGSNLNKGLHRFLGALSKLIRNKQKVKAVVICNNYQKQYFIKFLIALYGVSKYVEILDFQSSMDDFYKRINFLVMPSRHEAFGLVALEAASYGVMPIVSSSTGFAEIIAENVNGISFDVAKKAVKNLANAMKKAIDLYYDRRDEYNKVAGNCLCLAKMHTWKDFSDKILEKL